MKFLTPETLRARAHGGFYYLASPYTSPDPQLVQYRVHQVCDHLTWLLTKGVFAFSPIWHCHEASQRATLPTDWEWWWDFNKSFMEKSEGMILATMDGWNQSKGVAKEMAWMAEQRQPIYMMNKDATDYNLLQFAGGSWGA